MTGTGDRVDRWAEYLDPGVEPGTDRAVLPAAETDLLDRARVLLADSAVWDEPPPELRARLLAHVTTLADDETEAGAGADAPDPALAAAAPGAGAGTAAPPAVPGDPTAGAEPGATVHPLPGPAERAERSSTRVRRALWGAAAASWVAAAVLAVSVLRPDPAAGYPLAGTSYAPAATATATVDARPAGVAIDLDIKRLPPAPDGSYYAAWLRGPGGTVPVGTFHWRTNKGPVELWSGVEPARYPELYVTVQSELDLPDPAGRIVLRGTLGG